MNTKLNIELFMKIRERIATVPESYDQSNWVQLSSASPCGAAACLAGEAIICNAPTVAEGIAELWRLQRAELMGRAVPRRAAQLLGLEGDWVEFCNTGLAEHGKDTLIFDSEAQYWPADLRDEFRDGEEADAALGLLDWIIATEEVPVEFNY